VGVTGSVTLRYVVGTDGRAEGGSIKVISSTNKAFEEPAVETIGKCTYKAAKIKGTAVRQLVEQNVKFTIGG
jgi:TonB family protein